MFAPREHVVDVLLHDVLDVAAQVADEPFIARVFGGKAVAIAGASPGGFGTILSQNAWLPVFRTLGADLWAGGRLLVSRAGTMIDANGEIVDAGTRENLGKFVTGFVSYVQQRKAKRG